MKKQATKAVTPVKKKYDTQDKQIKALKKKGNIITFKNKFRFLGSAYSQITVTGFEKSRQTGYVKIIGFGRDTPWFANMEQLINAVDWAWMDRVS